MKKIVFYLTTLLLILSVGCNQSNNNLHWFDTKEKAIEYGIEQEGIDKSAILSIEKHEGETIVFYEKDNALGVANITESDEGYSWYRDSSYHGFEGDSPYITASFNIKTKTGKDFSILAGRAYDTSIQKMKITERGVDREIKIYDNSRLYFTIHESPLSSTKITPIRD